MCGIAGILFKHNEDSLATGKARIDRLDGCQHRGPDSTGFALYGAEHGGEIGDSQAMRFAPDHGEEERARAIANILKASCGEASMMARCTGKTNLHNLEPEDMRALTLATAEAMDIPLVGRN